MSRISWVGEIENRRIELQNEGYGSKKIASMLSFEFNRKVTRDMVAGRKKNVKKKNNEFYINVNTAIVNNLNNNVDNNLNNNSEQLFESDVYNLKDKYIMAEETKKEMKRIWDIFNTSTSKKILNLSDLHAPYMNFKKIEQAINDNLDCDICVLNGDIFDGESMSAFDKMHELDSSEEFNQVTKLLDVLSPRFKHIIWVGGNHDFQRFCRYIVKNIKVGLRSYAFDRLNPIKYLANQYPNVITINHNTLEIGDVVFKHPNGYSGVEMKTVINENDILYANRQDLPNPNFRAVIIGHTHDLGSYIKNGILLGETGCMCYTPDYRFTNPVKRRWTTGYARIELDKDNKIIFNKTRFISLDD